MKRILVTGGCGFVGRNLIRELIKDSSNQVICVDSMEPLTGCVNPRQWTEVMPYDFKNFEFYEIDCRNFFASDRSYFDEIYHLAAMVGGRMMIEHNPLAVGEDLSIDSLMFSWSIKSKVKKIINFSSSAAYPVNLQNHSSYRLLNEKDINFESHNIGLPDLSYGWAKLTCEYLGRLAFQKHGIESVVYRPFSGYGPTQDDTYPFPSILKRALKLSKEVRDEFVVWGSGDQMRDFIHIDDCIIGVLKTKDKISDGSAINLSTGILTSFKEFARLTLEEVGQSKLPIRGSSAKPEGVFARGGDTALQKKLGFSPSIDFSSGIKRALRDLERLL